MHGSPNRLGMAGGLTAALYMLSLSLLNSAGLYQSATAQMQEWHMFYMPDVGGTITGMLEAFVITYVVLYVAAWIYGGLGKKKKKK